MGNIPSDASLDLQNLKDRLAACDQEREQARVAAEDAQAEVRKLAQELTRTAAENARLKNLLVRCQDELLHLKSRQPSPDVAVQAEQETKEALYAEELQITLEELQVTAEELEEANATLRAANGMLERQVAERTAHLERTLAERNNLLRCKDRLICEIDNRVRDSLQMVMSLISIQAGRTLSPEVRRTLQATSARIQVVAQVHDLLFSAGGGERVEVGRYLEKLCAALSDALGVDRRFRALEVEVERVELPTDLAFPLALIVTELVTNAFRHAFAENAPGTVWVQFRREPGGMLRLMVADDGRGFPPHFQFSNGVGLGFQIIALMAHRLGAVPELGHASGSCVTLMIPMR